VTPDCNRSVTPPLPAPCPQPAGKPQQQRRGGAAGGKRGGITQEDLIEETAPDGTAAAAAAAAAKIAAAKLAGDSPAPSWMGDGKEAAAGKVCGWVNGEDVTGAAAGQERQSVAECVWLLIRCLPPLCLPAASAG
jgi:hypothetical protein